MPYSFPFLEPPFPTSKLTLRSKTSASISISTARFMFHCLFIHQEPASDWSFTRRRARARPQRTIKKHLGASIKSGVLFLDTPVVPFCPFYFGVSLLKLNSRKKGALIVNGLLGNRVFGAPSALKPTPYELLSKLLVSPLITPIVVPYNNLLCNAPLRSLDYGSYWGL